jgi:four helix bundle protein
VWYGKWSKERKHYCKKAYAFALGIVKLYKILQDRKEFVLSKQLLRAGTSIGANINEAVSGQSKRDFVHKLSIALKETRETGYWLDLLKDGDYIRHDEYESLQRDCIEIIRILSSIILTTKQKYFKTNP